MQKDIFEQLNHSKIDFSEIKNQKRIKLQSKKFARQIFDQGSYNMEMFEYVMHEYFKKQNSSKENKMISNESKEGYFSLKNIGSGLAIGVMCLIGYGVSVYMSPLLNMAMR